MKFCIKQGGNAARFFFCFDPAMLIVLSLWRILWEEFLGKFFWERIFEEEPLQEQAPNSDVFDIRLNFCIKQGGNAARFFVSTLRC